MGRTRRWVVALTVGVLLAGCGSGSESPSASPTTDGGSSGSAASSVSAAPSTAPSAPADTDTATDGTPEQAPGSDVDQPNTLAPEPPGAIDEPTVDGGAAAPPNPPQGELPGESVADPSAAPPAPAPVGEGFSTSVSEIDEALATRMASSWRPGCPVPLADLRYLTVTYRGFDGGDHTGELVVASSVTADVATIFEGLYAAGYPIESLRLVDDFGGSDDASMAANNSSAFNCRPVTGGGGFSEHSYGTAIDLNPVQNPYVSGSSVLPEAGRAYAGRSPGPGVIEAGDPVVTAFAAAGWTWGGNWASPIDYQHFSVSGR